MTTTPRFFVRCWLLLTFAVLLVLVMLNLLVDPTGAFPGLHLKLFENLRYLECDRVSKAETARRGDWEVIILGSSRAKAGFPADHPFCLTNQCCNLAMDGARLPELAMALDFARRKSPLKHVILGLDWFMFIPGATVLPEFNDSHFSPEFQPWTFYCKQLLSKESTARSWQAVRRKLRGYQPPAQERNGFYNHHLGAKTCQHELFDRVLHQTSGYSYQDVDPHTVDQFRHMVRVCRDHHIDLQIPLLPVHALDMEVMYAGGCWPHFEELKTQLVNVLAEEGVEGKFGLWDFTGYSGPPTEPIPPDGDAGARMKYYFENSHFTPECGRLVLDIMLGNCPTNGFGAKLTRANLKTHLAQVLADRAVFARTNAADVQWVHHVVAEVTGNRNAQ